MQQILPPQFEEASSKRHRTSFAVEDNENFKNLQAAVKDYILSEKAGVKAKVAAFARQYGLHRETLRKRILKYKKHENRRLNNQPQDDIAKPTKRGRKPALTEGLEKELKL
jgi:hypothetical protein